MLFDRCALRVLIAAPRAPLVAYLGLAGLVVACYQVDPEPQIALLKSLQPEVREKAAGKLVIYGDPIVPRLIEETHSDYTRVRFEVARILGRILDPRSTDAMIRLLDDRSFTVAAYAAEGLGKLRAQAALPSLLRFPDSMSRVFRQQVVWALGRCYDDTAHAALRDSVLHVIERALSDPAPDVRVSALQSARQLGYRGMVSELIRMSGDSSAEVRHVVVQALGQIVTGDTPRPVDSITEHQRAQIVERLLESLEEPIQSIRTKAVRALERMGPPARAESALRRLLSHGTTEDQREARRVLEALTGQALQLTHRTESQTS
jgi:HEAT repeat protein